MGWALCLYANTLKLGTGLWVQGMRTSRVYSGLLTYRYKGCSGLGLVLICQYPEARDRPLGARHEDFKGLQWPIDLQMQGLHHEAHDLGLSTGPLLHRRKSSKMAGPQMGDHTPALGSPALGWQYMLWCHCP